MKKMLKQLGAGTAALALVFALAGTALAADATVDGHLAFSSDANNPDFWETNGITECMKLDAGEGDLGDDNATYVLGASYALVVVKAGSGTYANTIFEDVAAGETVFADTNGNNVSDPGGQDGDKNISHIIFCDETETTSTTSFESSEESTTDSQSSSSSSSSTTSFSDSVSDSTTQPPTDTIGNTGSGQQSSGLWMLLAVLGVLAGSVIVLAPSKAKSQD